MVSPTLNNWLCPLTFRSFEEGVQRFEPCGHRFSLLVKPLESGKICPLASCIQKVEEIVEDDSFKADVKAVFENTNTQLSSFKLEIEQYKTKHKLNSSLYPSTPSADLCWDVADFTDFNGEITELNKFLHSNFNKDVSTIIMGYLEERYNESLVDKCVKYKLYCTTHLDLDAIESASKSATSKVMLLYFLHSPFPLPHIDVLESSAVMMFGAEEMYSRVYEDGELTWMQDEDIVKDVYESFFTEFQNLVSKNPMNRKISAAIIHSQWGKHLPHKKNDE